MYFVLALRHIALHIAVYPANLQHRVSCTNFVGMKRNILILILLLAGHCLVRAQQVVSGTVTDGIFGLGLTESFASGRKSEGRTTPYYNSLDASVTCLASKHVIVYTSLSNLL